ncbi:MAG: histidinol-phosphate transaminase [Sulfitobacter sp.]
MTVARKHIAQMAPYALAELTVPDGVPLISLSQNECFRPPSPAAVCAAHDAASAGALYPDPEWTELRAVLGDLHGIPASGILCGNGSLDLIGCIARVFSGSNRSVLAPAHAYPFFSVATRLANARFDTAPEDRMTVSVDRMIDAVRPDTGVVFIANPGNPTGTHIPKSELQRLRGALRSDILLVIDEAYGEFSDTAGETCFDMVAAGNTAILRTFSKAYGMAGFRTGWGLFPPEVGRELRKVMNPNNVASVSQAAAVAAIKDQSYMRETCALTTALRTDVTTSLRQGGFDVLHSFTNFVLIDMAHEKAAGDAFAALKAKGIFLRPQTGAGLPQALRMTIGPDAANQVAVTGLLHWKKEYSE